jgi:hypothetical protein
MTNSGAKRLKWCCWRFVCQLPVFTDKQSWTAVQDCQRWLQYDPSKCWEVCTQFSSVTAQKVWCSQKLLIVTKKKYIGCKNIMFDVSVKFYFDKDWNVLTHTIKTVQYQMFWQSMLHLLGWYMQMDRQS